MGIVKKVLKATTGIDLDKKRKAEEEAKRQAAEQAELAAKLQADQAKVAADAAAGQGEGETVDPTTSTSTKKKKISQGRRGLTVARSGGGGINV